MDFDSILDRFLDDFSCYFHYLFEVVFLMIFYRFLDRSLNCVNPKIIEIRWFFIVKMQIRFFAIDQILHRFSIRF